MVSSPLPSLLSPSAVLLCRLPSRSHNCACSRPHFCLSFSFSSSHLPSLPLPKISFNYQEHCSQEHVGEVANGFGQCAKGPKPHIQNPDRRRGTVVRRTKCVPRPKEQRKLACTCARTLVRIACGADGCSSAVRCSRLRIKCERSCRGRGMR